MTVVILWAQILSLEPESELADVMRKVTPAKLVAYYPKMNKHLSLWENGVGR
jgi:hypothetical protein